MLQQKTLDFQGGKMNNKELVEFENDPLFPLYIKMREWDDKAKEINVKLNNINYYLRIINELIT